MTKVPSKVVVARIEKGWRICRVISEANGQNWCCLLVTGVEGIKKGDLKGSRQHIQKIKNANTWGLERQRRDVLWPNREEKRKTTDWVWSAYKALFSRAGLSKGIWLLPFLETCPNTTTCSFWRDKQCFPCVIQSFLASPDLVAALNPSIKEHSSHVTVINP